MDQMCLVVAAAMLAAAEQGFVTPEGMVPSATPAEDGSVVVSAGDASLTIDADTVAEMVADMLGDDDAAEMPAEEMPSEEPSA